MTQICERFWDVKSQTLDLSNLVGKMRDLGVQVSSIDTRKLGGELAQAAPATFWAQVKTLNLASNRLSSLEPLPRLLESLTGLVNLSLSDNGLSSLSDLSVLSGNPKLKSNIAGLFLTGNPCCAIRPPAGAAPAADSDPTWYIATVQRHFPNLTFLDGNTVSRVLGFDLPKQTADVILPPPGPSFFDSADTKNRCGSFVSKYFALYDDLESRQQLFSAYTETSTFSLSLSPTATAAPEFFRINRNLLQPALMTDMDNPSSPALSRLLRGNVDICYELKRLPSLKHNVSGFTADAFLVKVGASPMICLKISGQMLETSTYNLRTFHRVFMLKPPNADAGSKGWMAQIVSDSWYIGDITGSAPPPSAAAVPGPASPGLGLGLPGQPLMSLAQIPQQISLGLM